MEPGKKPVVLTYELVPVLNDTPPDATVAKLVENAEQKIEDQYGAEKLNEVIGHTDVRLVSGKNGVTAYSKFLVDAMKDVAGTDIGLDFGEFHSSSAQPKGDVTLRKLMEMYPRKLNAEQNEGLYVYRFKVPGWALKIVLQLSIQFGYELSLSGVSYQKTTVGDEQFQSEQKAFGNSWKANALNKERLIGNSILINGYPLRLLKNYSVAAPEFIVRGAYAISFLTRLIIMHGRPSPYTIWDASTQYLRKVKNIENVPTFTEDTHHDDEYPYAKELMDAVLNEVQSAKIEP